MASATPDFHSLPLELREMIWEFCLPGPRVINPHLASTLPLILSVNKESRNAALRNYIVVYGTRDCQQDDTILHWTGFAGENKPRLQDRFAFAYNPRLDFVYGVRYGDLGSDPFSSEKYSYFGGGKGLCMAREKMRSGNKSVVKSTRIRRLIVTEFDLLKHHPIVDNQPEFRHGDWLALEELLVFVEPSKFEAPRNYAKPGCVAREKILQPGVEVQWERELGPLIPLLIKWLIRSLEVCSKENKTMPVVKIVQWEGMGYYGVWRNSSFCMSSMSMIR